MSTIYSQGVKFKIEQLHKGEMVLFKLFQRFENTKHIINVIGLYKAHSIWGMQ